MGLTPDEVAYMRATQTEHHPTPFQVVNAEKAPDGAGGMATTLVEGDTVPGRLDGQPSRVPDYLSELVTRGPVASISLTYAPTDLAQGSLLVATWGDAATPEDAWEVVSLGEPDPWTTALVVWVQRWREVR